MADRFFVEGFSKKNKEQKIDWLRQTYLKNKPEDIEILRKYWLPDKHLQSLHEGFAENTLSNFTLPFAVAPNFLINGKLYAVPMVTEESSVVAAAAKAAKFWFEHGGFRAEVKGKIKTGHIHFFYDGSPADLQKFLDDHKQEYAERLRPFTENMEKRGGGIRSVELENHSDKLPGYYTWTFRFDTADSMGANFINTILEEWSDYFEEDFAREYGRKPEVLLRILSNYNPECLVKVRGEAVISALKTGMSGEEYARRFVKALDIARVNPYRAVTHNKGIMNGIDAVVLATGNDFRAVEAGAHAYASRSGKYTSLSNAFIRDGKLIFEMEIPLALGTVGGVTRIHPMAKTALDILQNPDAEELMKIAAATGLAQNFSAVHSLITEGIQKGHMRMHLNNILLQMNVTEEERKKLSDYFRNKKVHVRAVKEKLEEWRKNRA